MNPFTQHPNEQGIGYREHAGFALVIALRLACSAGLFALHGLFPWSPIPRRYDLEATAGFLDLQNGWIEHMAGRGRTVIANGDAPAGQTLYRIAN